MLLEDAKRAAGRLTGLGRPTPKAARALVRDRKPGAWRFRDDGLVPNHPAWPALHYRGAVALDAPHDPAAIFEVLFESHGWKDGWRDVVYDYLHYHSDQHEVLGFARGHATLRLGGAKGRTIKVKAGDVLVLPAGTGHQCLSMSDDLLVVGGYPRKGGYDMCHPGKGEHDRSAAAIARVPAPKTDPLYGAHGPLTQYWQTQEKPMARKYSKAASKKVERALHEMHEGTLRSGKKGPKVKSRKQAIAIGLSEARAEGKKVPKAKKASKKKAARKTPAKKTKR